MLPKKTRNKFFFSFNLTDMLDANNVPAKDRSMTGFKCNKFPKVHVMKIEGLRTSTCKFCFVSCCGKPPTFLFKFTSDPFIAQRHILITFPSEETINTFL